MLKSEKFHHVSFEDTHTEKAHSNKTPALTKSMKIDICVAGTSNQLSS